VLWVFLLISWVVSDLEFLFFSDSTRFETLTVCGIRGREKRLSTSLWAISGISLTNGVLMEPEFLFPCPMGRHLFSTMFLTFPQFKYSPAAVSGMLYTCR